jgi:hypothetical protein
VKRRTLPLWNEVSVMAITVMTEAYREAVEFFSRRPTPEQIAAFHASDEVNARVQDLLQRERDHEATEDEVRELDSYLHVEHFVRLMKIEAHRQLAERASRTPA